MKKLLNCIMLVGLIVPNYFLDLKFVEWKMVKQKDELAIYDYQQENKKFKTFRVEGSLHSPMVRFENILDNANYLEKWFPMAKEAYLVEGIGLDDKIVRIIFDFPFPLKIEMPT